MNAPMVAEEMTVAFRNFFISVEREIKASAAEAWDLLTDTAKWPRWGPTVTAVACPERMIHRGSKGRVRTPIGLWVPFHITDYEHLHFWSWRIAGVRATGHRLVPLTRDSCRVLFELPVYRWPYQLVCRKALRNLAGMLEAEDGY